jgi:DNA polymerase-3 subunit alpha
MGKKISAIMAEQRERFVQGALQNGISAEKSQELFNLIEKFGGYGFNKSHSAAYALIAYQTAYLKAHYPLEFMASLLTSEMQSTDGVVKYIAECRQHGIPILPPDINESGKVFMVSDEGIRFGLAAVKNVGEGAIDSIIETRGQEKFQSIFDFCERVDLRKVNKRVLESLIKSGAFDAFGANRSQLYAILEDLIEYGQRIQKEKSDPQMGLFELGNQPSNINCPKLPEIVEWKEKELLANEKEMLGFYITGHPLHRYRDLIEKFTNADADSIKTMNDHAGVRLAGMIRSVKVIKTKRGDLMAFATVEDMQGTFEATIFSALYAQVNELLAGDDPILVEGQLQKDENSTKVLAGKIVPIQHAEETWTVSLHFYLNLADTDRDLLTRLHDVFKNHPGACEAYLHLRNEENTEAVIALPDHFKLKPTDSLKKEVTSLIGYQAIESVCSQEGVSDR